MKHFWTGLLALGVVGCTAPQQTQKDNISGIYPKLAFYNNEGECGTGAVVPWAGSLWLSPMDLIYLSGHLINYIR